MSDPEFYFVLDVESNGLYGEGFAAGYVVVSRDGVEQDCGRYACDPALAGGDDEGRAWVAANLPWVPRNCTDPTSVRRMLWEAWREWHRKGAVMAADCPFPVETFFLARCVEEQNPRLERGRRIAPYPLIDVASVRLAAGKDPLATVVRWAPGEEPKHDPLADARQSARLLIEALNTVRNWRHQAEAVAVERFVP